jgi:hypothetical protein
MHNCIRVVRMGPLPGAVFFPRLTVVVVFVGLAGGAMAQESASKLTEALRSPDEKARIQAMDSLGRLGPGAKEAVSDRKSTRLNSSHW